MLPMRPQSQRDKLLPDVVAPLSGGFLKPSAEREVDYLEYYIWRMNCHGSQLPILLPPYHETTIPDLHKNYRRSIKNLRNRRIQRKKVREMYNIVNWLTM